MVITPDEYTIAHPWKDEKSKQHVYDRVFDPSASQEEVFADTKVVFFLSVMLTIIYFWVFLWLFLVNAKTWLDFEKQYPGMLPCYMYLGGLQLV